MRLRTAPLSAAALSSAPTTDAGATADAVAAAALQRTEASVVASWEMAENARLYTVTLSPPIEPLSSDGGTAWWLEIVSSWGAPLQEGTELRDVQFTSTERQVLTSSASFWAQVDVERPTRAPTATPRTAAPTTSAYHTACLLWNNCEAWAKEQHHRRALGEIAGEIDAETGWTGAEDLAGWRVPLVEKWTSLPVVDGSSRVIHHDGVWVKADVLAEQAPPTPRTGPAGARDEAIAPRIASEQLVCAGWAPRFDAVSGARRAWSEVCETDKAFCQMYNPCCDAALYCLYVHYEGSHSCDWDEWIPADSPLVTFEPPPQYWSAPTPGWDASSADEPFAPGLVDGDGGATLENASTVVVMWSTQVEGGGEAAWLNEPPTVDPSSTAETRAFNKERWQSAPDANYLQWVVLAVMSTAAAGLGAGGHAARFNATSVTVALPGDGDAPAVGNPGRCWLQAASVATAIVWDDVVRIDISAPGQRSATVRIPAHGRSSAFWRLVLERPVLPHFAGAAPRALAVESITFSGYAVRTGLDAPAPLDELILDTTVVGFSSERDGGLHAVANIALPTTALWAADGTASDGALSASSRQWQSAALERRRRRRRLTGGIAYAPQFTGTSVVDEFVILRIAADGADLAGDMAADDAPALPRVARIDVLLWSRVLWEGAVFGFAGPPMHCTASVSSHATLASATADGAEWTRLGSFAIAIGTERVSYAPPPRAAGGAPPRARFVKLRFERMRMIASGEELWTGEGAQGALPTFVNGIAVRRVRLVAAPATVA
jgi:hypothetical protein